MQPLLNIIAVSAFFGKILPAGLMPANFRRALPTGDRPAVLMLALVALALALLVSPKSLSDIPAYNRGDVAAQDYKAPRDFTVENSAATKAAKNRAASSVLPVYDFDEAHAETTVAGVNHAFSEMYDVAVLPEMRAKLHEERMAEYRQALAEYEAKYKEYRRGIRAFQERNPSDDTKSLAPVAPAAPRKPPDPDRVDAVLLGMKPDFEKRLGFEVSDGAYSVLVRERFDPAIAERIGQIVTTIMDGGVVGNPEDLLAEADRGIILRTLPGGSEEKEIALKRFYGPDQAKMAVRKKGDPILRNLNYALMNAILEISQGLVSRPNMSPNRAETEKRRRLVMDEVPPVLVQVKAGEMLIREGERVGPEHLVKLKALASGSGQTRAMTRSLGIGMLVLAFLLSFYFVNFRQREGSPRRKTKDLFLICLILVSFFLIAKVFLSLSYAIVHPETGLPLPSPTLYSAPMAAAAMVACVFLGLRCAMPLAGILSFSVAALFGHAFETWAFFLTSGILAAFWVSACRERNVFIKAGLRIGIVNIWLVFGLYLAKGAVFGPAFFYDTTAAFLGGLLSGILTAGIVPLIELFFSYTTDIKLLELANLDRPIMKRLMMEAPGSYHHSLIVGSMVEAAASQIGANPLLAKVGAYYHDIGKIKKPLYFIENQMDGKNRHDKLAPNLSSLILVAHVKDGVELAEEHGLGTVIRDMIAQHHGTSLIQYFYDKAVALAQQKGEEQVTEDEFRYPGPKPQTKEAGLVMLADVVEAASRTLDNPTPSRVQGLVQRLINKIFSDGQLNECELTLKDLNEIARTFNKILAGIHHHRIEYADQGVKTNGKGKKTGAGADNKPSKDAQDSDKETTRPNTGALKRLGVS